MNYAVACTDTAFRSLSSQMQPLCGETHLLSSVPLVRRFCRRGASACGDVDTKLAALFQATDSLTSNPVILIEEDAGLGFGAGLQAETQLLLLALQMRRRVMIWSRGDVFNRGGSLLAPSRAVQLALHISRLPSGLSLATRNECEEVVRARLGSTRLLSKFRCEPYPSGWLPTLDSHSIDPVQSSSWWDFRHRRLKRHVPLESVFPNHTAYVIDKRRMFRFLVSDLVASSDATGQGRAGAHLGARLHDLAGPGCLVRFLMHSATTAVLTAVAETLPPPLRTAVVDPGTAPPLLVGVHIRRGDKSISLECLACVNPSDEAVTRPRDDNPRVQLDWLGQELGRLNGTIDEMRSALGREVYAFVASDTLRGLRMAQQALSLPSNSPIGPSRVLSTHLGRVVVSAKTHVVRSGRSQDAIKIAADFLLLALADVVVALGGSAFSSNAAAMGFGIFRSNAGPLGQQQLAAIRTSG